MASNTGLPLVASLNPDRRAKVRARLAEHGRDKITEAIRKVGESAYCTGQVNGFRANLDFLLQPSSFLKIIEGNYDGPRNGPANFTNRPVQQRRNAGLEGAEIALAMLDGSYRPPGHGSDREGPVGEQGYLQASARH